MCSSKLNEKTANKNYNTMPILILFLTCLEIKLLANNTKFETNDTVEVIH